MVRQGYWLKIIFILSLVAIWFSLPIKCNINPCIFSFSDLSGFNSEGEIYFNNIKINSRRVIYKEASLHLSFLFVEDINLKIFLSLNNNFSTCRYSKVMGAELNAKNNITTNTSLILLACNKNPIKHTFISFPLRC